MRNLKRALSLALTAAMLIGMMVVAASASYNDFTDKGDVVNTEAVSTLVELGVINGKEDGSYFDPTGIVTRAEMAKMITVVLNGGKDPVLGVKDKPSFTDIKGTWAESYIEYCTSPSVGVISGRGDGRFDPTATVTAAEAAKMLLVAMGYNASVFKLTGASWQINTDVYANQAKLYDGLSITSSAALTRDNAAQMIHNALQSPLMERSWSMNQQTGQITEGYNLADGTMGRALKTLLSEKFGVSKYSGIVVATEGGTMNGPASTLQVAGQTLINVDNIDDTNVASARLTFKVSTDVDMIGKRVTVYAKTLKNGVYQEVFGTPVVAATTNAVTYTNTFATQAALEADLAAKGITGVNAVAANTMVNFVQGSAVANTAALWALMGAGIEVTVINNDAGDTIADYVIVKQPTAGTVTAVNANGNSGAGYVTVTPLSGSLAITGQKYENVIGYENIAVNDIVLYYQLGTKYYVEKADMVTVTPASSVVSSSTVISLTADGATYYDSALNTANSLSGLTLGVSADLYLDECGYVVYSKATDVVPNYLLVTAVDNATAFGSARIRAVLQDGTALTATVSTVSNLAYGQPSYTNPVQNDIYSYVVLEDGTYALYPLSTDDDAITTIAASNATLAGGKIGNDKTIFVVKNRNGTWSSYTGIANVPTMQTVTTTYSYEAVAGTVSIVFVDNAVPAGASGKDIYILSATPSVTRGTTGNVYTYSALVDGVVAANGLVVNATTPNTTPAITAGYYTGIALNGDGSVNEANLTGVSYGAKVTAYSDGVISDGTLTLTIKDGVTKVIAIDGATKTAVEGTLGDIVYVSGNSSACSTIVLVRASSINNDANYNVAGTIYVLR